MNLPTGRALFNFLGLMGSLGTVVFILAIYLNNYNLASLALAIGTGCIALIIIMGFFIEGHLGGKPGIIFGIFLMCIGGFLGSIGYLFSQLGSLYIIGGVIVGIGVISAIVGTFQ